MMPEEKKVNKVVKTKKGKKVVIERVSMFWFYFFIYCFFFI